MLRVRNLSNKYQKRLIRPLYAQTQATPYATKLHSAFRDSSGSFVAPTTSNDDSDFLLTRSANAYLLKNGLVPGTVMVKSKGEDSVVVAAGANSASNPFGLLANFVGGDLDDLGDENYVGVWRGPDSVFELLAPAFVDTSLSSAVSSESAGAPVKLYAAADGRLACAADCVSSASSATVVAHLIERVSASRIIIDLKI